MEKRRILGEAWAENDDDDTHRAADENRANDDVVATASGVAVTNNTRETAANGWKRPDRNLLVVHIHPWCMLHGSDIDRRSELPPPGFLEQLKAKLLARLHSGTTDEFQQLQRRAALAAPSPRHGNGAVVVRRHRNNGYGDRDGGTATTAFECCVRYAAAIAALGAAQQPSSHVPFRDCERPPFDFLTDRQ